MDKCNICHNPYSPNCDWNQGRCPNHPPMIKIQPKDTSLGHFWASIVKSIIRVSAGIALIMGNLVLAGALLIVAEVFGIVEEMI